MASRLALYHPNGRIGLGSNPFGKDIANTQLFQALARHGGFERLDVLGNVPVTSAEIAEDLLEGRPSSTRIEAGNILAQSLAVEAGAVLRGQPHLDTLAWLRRSRARDRAYSLMGLVHTIAPPAVREYMAMSVTAPTQPWDAVICTSPAVQDAVRAMMDEWGASLAARFGGTRRPAPNLPLIPLGVDLESLQARADRPQARAALRQALGLAEADVLILWVGRLSFYEKAFPQPMFKAIEQAVRATGAKVHFALAGWFPSEQHCPMYEKAAQAHCPSVPVHFLDGNDAEMLGRAWAGADIFLSLVDNIQETFGITPLEAMAAGLPVVASDWDGYRYTMRDGVEAFLIPTLAPAPNRLGQAFVDRHVMLLDSYQQYVGVTAQHTAVHIGRCAEALAALIGSPELRKRMGAAGRERVRTAFDWPVVVGLYRELIDELARIRAVDPGYPEGARADPVRLDPYSAFSGFPNTVLAPEMRLRLAPGVTSADLARTPEVQLDAFAGGWRANLEECARMFAAIERGEALTVADAAALLPPNRRDHAHLALVWMAKLGLIDWL